MPAPLDPSVFDALRNFQRFCGENAKESGFDDDDLAAQDLFDTLRSEGKGDLAQFLQNAVDSQSLMLISDELSEAHEELRSGKAMTEDYLSSVPGKETKPEGIPSELADGVIRYMHIAERRHIDLAGIIERKLAYNASRGHKHGRKF